LVGGVSGGSRLLVGRGVGCGGGLLHVLRCGVGGWLSILSSSSSCTLVTSVAGSSRSDLGQSCGGSDCSDGVSGNSVDLNFSACHRVEY